MRISWEDADRSVTEGLDRCVFYKAGTRLGVAWNGLKNIENQSEGSSSDIIYIDGAPVATLRDHGFWVGKISAFTYPPDLDSYLGNSQVRPGFYVPNQSTALRVGLSWRVMRSDGSYVLHILWSVLLIPHPIGAKTNQELPSLADFVFDAHTINQDFPEYQKSSYVYIDSRFVNPHLLAEIEDLLYGTESVDAKQPTPQELLNVLGDFVVIRITDHEDGSWTAEGPDSLITMIDSDTFQIAGVIGYYEDPSTYWIEDTY